jgi:CoA:oxalate CoA-transferase
MSGSSAPLRGVTVVDLSQQLPGPYATLLLGRLGARVIKVEPPAGDVARTIDPTMFATVNAGKESIVLDLKSKSGRCALHALAATADVLLEGFRPGVTQRLGADYETLRALRPELVYCSLSGFGAEGPYRDLPGHDLNYLGLAGGVEPGDGFEVPRPIGIPVIDLAAGSLAALAVVAALRDAQANGTGAALDIAMLDSALFWSAVKAGASAPEPLYTVLPAADRRRIAFLEDKFWPALCAALNWSEWARDATLATNRGRQARATEIHARLRETVSQRPAGEWLAILRSHDVPATPVNDRVMVGHDPQVRARGVVDSDGRCEAPIPAALRAQGQPSAPRLGEHGEAILREFGVSFAIG